MKKFLVTLLSLLCLGASPLLANGEIHDEVALNFMAKGEYRLAMEILRNNAVSKGTSDAYQEILTFQSELIKIAAKKHTYSVPCAIESDFPELAAIDNASARAGIEAEVGGCFGCCVAILDVIASGGYFYYEFERIKSETETVAQSLRLVDEKECTETLEYYDILKESIADLMSLLNDRIKEVPLEEMDMYLSFLQKARVHKDTIKSDRTKYLSYSVISPYLWLAARHLFLAEGVLLGCKDEDALNLAVKYLTRPCHRDFLNQSNEVVRMQFLDVYKRLKNCCSKEEFEDYQTRSTLLDCFDKSKNAGGADSWFP